MKRSFASVAILLLAGIYLATLIFSMMNSELAFGLFKASLLLTIAVPCILYAMLLVYKFLNKKNII